MVPPLCHPFSPLVLTSLSSPPSPVPSLALSLFLFYDENNVFLCFRSISVTIMSKPEYFILLYSPLFFLILFLIIIRSCSVGDCEVVRHSDENIMPISQILLAMSKGVLLISFILFLLFLFHSHSSFFIFHHLFFLLCTNDSSRGSTGDYTPNQGRSNSSNHTSFQDMLPLLSSSKAACSSLPFISIVCWCIIYFINQKRQT